MPGEVAGRRVDPDDEKAYVDRTKDQIKNAPEFDENRYRDDTYRNDLGSYYAAFAQVPKAATISAVYGARKRAA